jgi:hypothetical protein
MALRQPHSRGVAHKTAVIEIRNWKAESPVKKNLPRRRFQQISSAHNFRDAHGGIVDDDRQLVSGNIVAPPNDEVAKIASGRNPLGAEMQVVEQDFLAIRNPKAPIKPGRPLRRCSLHSQCSDGRLVRPATAKPSGPDHGTRRPTPPRIDRLIITIIRRPSCQSHILARASTRIDRPNLPQPLPRLQIEISALTLRIGSVRPSAIRPLLPGNSQPVQVLDHRIDEFGTAALRIQILISQNQGPAPLRRSLRGNPKRPRMPDVEQARGRRRQAPTIVSRI